MEGNWGQRILEIPKGRGQIGKRECSRLSATDLKGNWGLGAVEVWIPQIILDDHLLFSIKQILSFCWEQLQNKFRVQNF